MNKKLSIKTLTFVIVTFFTLSLSTSCIKINPWEDKVLFSLPDTIVFPAGIDSDTIILQNDGNVTLEYGASTSSYFINVTPRTYTLFPGEQIEIIVSIDRENTDDDEYLRFFINNQEFNIPIIIQEFGFRVTEELYFGENISNATLNICNTGNIDISYQIEAATDFVTISSNTTGILVSNQQANISIDIDRESIIANHAEPSINVTINDTVMNVPLIVEKKVILPKTIVDAEYSKVTDLLVYVSDDFTVNIFDSSTETTETIMLTYLPTCVSLSMDGTKAAVGHDAHVSYIDLLSKQVINTHDISCTAGDIVMGSNGWAYAFPKSGYDIHCVDLTNPNSIETTHTGYSIYHGTKAKMHPSGKYIYGADNGLSPMDIEKYDIQAGTASYMYDSPYHGDYPMGGDLWLTEDGSCIITRGGAVYKTSELQERDMLYNGRINIPDITYPYCPWIDHSEINQEFYVIVRPDYDEPKSPFIYVINANNLIFKRIISLEKYQVTDYQNNTTLYEAEPYFAFANSSGSKIYVLTKAVGSGLVHEWAMQKFDIGQ